MGDWFAFWRFGQRLKGKMEQVHQLDDPWSSARQKEIYEKSMATYLAAGDSVLEIGCGDGVVTEIMVRGGANVTAVEVSRRAVTKARRRLGSFAGSVRFVRRDIHRFRSEERFNLVLLSFVLDYLGIHQFPRRFVWLMLRLSSLTDQILVIQPINGESDRSTLEAFSVIMQKCGMTLRESSVEQESYPPLWVGLFVKNAPIR